MKYLLIILAVAVLFCVDAKDTNRFTFTMRQQPLLSAEDLAFHRGLREGIVLAARFFTNDFTSFHVSKEEGVWISYLHPDTDTEADVRRRTSKEFWPEPRTNFCVSVKIDSDGELTVTKEKQAKERKPIVAFYEDSHAILYSLSQQFQDIGLTNITFLATNHFILHGTNGTYYYCPRPCIGHGFIDTPNQR